MLIWPSTLPQSFLLTGYSASLVTNPVLETSMQSGPSKRRLLFKRVPYSVTGSQVLTKEQWDTLQDFYFEDTNYGILPFEWKLPQLSGDREFRFMGKPVEEWLSCDDVKVTYNFEVQNNV